MQTPPHKKNSHDKAEEEGKEDEWMTVQNERKKRVRRVSGTGRRDLRE